MQHDDDLVLHEDPSRRVIDRLYQLSQCEVETEDAVRRLHERTKALFEGLNAALVGAGNGHAVRVSEIDADARFAPHWSVLFRGRIILAFSCVIGAVPSPRPVLGKCVVKTEHDERALHLTRQNGTLMWEMVRDAARPVLLTDDALLALLDAQAERELRRYLPTQP